MYKESEDYIRGLKDGIMMYAHWHDGTQYVGSTGKTLKKALLDIECDYCSEDDNNGE